MLEAVSFHRVPITSPSRQSGQPLRAQPVRQHQLWLQSCRTVRDAKRAQRIGGVAVYSPDAGLPAALVHRINSTAYPAMAMVGAADDWRSQRSSGRSIQTKPSLPTAEQHGPQRIGNLPLQRMLEAVSFHRVPITSPSRQSGQPLRAQPVRQHQLWLQSCRTVRDAKRAQRIGGVAVYSPDAGLPAALVHRINSTAYPAAWP
jgi:hypothetical protein